MTEPTVDSPHPTNSSGQSANRQLSDKEHWANAVEGDTESFGVIFDRHAKAVHRYCARRTTIDAADDLVSIVFLEAWRRREDIILQENSALPWLMGVARRVILHRTRTSIRHRKALERLPLHVVEPDHADETATRIDRRRQLDLVEQAFRNLSRNDQDVLALCVGQGLDYLSASIALGVPVGTVRSRLSRARTHLAELTTNPDNPQSKGIS